MSKLVRFQKKLARSFPSFQATAKDDCVILTGEANTWSEVIEAGKIAAKSHYFAGVINNITLKGYEPKPIKRSSINDQKLEGKHIDVLVVGGGVVGCAILRELSKYNLTSLLVEKEEDLAMGASSRNDGCVHVGIDLPKNSLKLKYLLRSRKIYAQMCQDLDVPYREDGQSVAFTNGAFRLIAGPVLRLKGHINHIPGGVKVLSRKQLLKLEPNLASDIKFGVHFPGGACTSPYELTIALGESAVLNGAEISLNTIVLGMKLENGRVVSVQTNRGTVYPQVVVNAAGAYSDVIADMMEDRFYTIHPRKGTDTILDKAVTPNLSRTSITVYQKMGEQKKSHSKGGGIMPTIDMNTLVGPDAVEVPDREDFTTEKGNIDAVFAKHKQTIQALSERDIITYFSGIRAATYEEDFVVQKGKWTKNVIHAAGIQSPGLTAAPAIGIDVAKWASELLKATPKSSWNPKRPGIVRTRFLSDEDRNALIQKNPAYGHIVCRCEEISEGEIIDAIHSVVPPTTVDGIKRRVRAGMGRCQGGFCQPMVVALLAKEEKRDELDLTKKGEGKLFYRHTKEGQ